MSVPAAFDEGDKVTDKARDKVGASPGLGHPIQICANLRHLRLKNFAPPLLRVNFPVAFDKGDKVTDKARDKVDESPEGARYTSPGQRPGEWAKNKTRPEGALHSAEKRP